MSPGHFSHHASLSVKGWWFGWIPELTVLSSAVSRGMQLLFQSYVTSNKSDSSNLCTVDTSRGCSLMQLKQWRQHGWEKRKLTFTLRSHPPRQWGVGLLLWQQLSSVIQTPVNNVAIQKCSVWFFSSFHIVVGKTVCTYRWAAGHGTAPYRQGTFCLHCTNTIK